MQPERRTYPPARDTGLLRREEVSELAVDYQL